MKLIMPHLEAWQSIINQLPASYGQHQIHFKKNPCLIVNFEYYTGMPTLLEHKMQNKMPHGLTAYHDVL